ncbi:hypothetical protein DS745_04215 [Anaerobacillus alkaliphilus]|uniref:Uncharacterized protein n=1 Tax=Anaerobacillus alkaliphilus TaxID=1548597 RepID=A0A4V1LH09_9BACI|nr:hypothetical protein [Anaerobacillus alkaliphilus]RXJ04595.1 hypothetical protein DS745_04215 [Anaerobacillus alkaliphilus]
MRKLLFIFILVLVACQNSTLEETMKQVRSTDLANESIAGIRLGDALPDQFEEDPDNEYYRSKRNYDLYKAENIFVNIERSTGEIVSILPHEKNLEAKTARGIGVGDTLSDVITAYGENYYEYTDRSQGSYKIGYIDHDRNISLTFYVFLEKVTAMTLRYAFEQLVWYQN